MPLCGLLKSLVAGACVGFFFLNFIYYMVNTHACACTWICFLFITATLWKCGSNSMWEILCVLGHLRVNLQKRVWLFTSAVSQLLA